MRIAETAPPYGGPPDAGPPEDMPERALWRLWQKRAARQQEFRTPQGRRVRVLFPGRRGVTAGPDFRAALLEIEGLGLVRGDVEIHRRADDWDAHGHTDDPNYSGVALHAALDTPSADAAPAHTPRPGGGGQIPLISLTPLLSPDAAADDEPPPGELGSTASISAATEPGADANPDPPPGNADAIPGPPPIGGAAVETGAANPGPPPVDGDAAAELDNANPGQPSSVATAKPAGPGRLPGNTRIPGAANPGQPSGLATTETAAPNLIPPDGGVAAAKPGRIKPAHPDAGVVAAELDNANPGQPSGVATAKPGGIKLTPPDDGVAAAKPGGIKLTPPDDGVAAGSPGRPKLAPPDDGVAAAPSRPKPVPPGDGVAAAKPGRPKLIPPDDGVAAAKPGRPKLAPPDDGVAAAKPGRPKLSPPDDGVAAAKPGRPKPVPPDDGVAAAKPDNANPGQPDDGVAAAKPDNANPGQPSGVATAKPGGPKLVPPDDGVAPTKPGASGRLPGDAKPVLDATPPAFDTLWGLLAAQGFPPPASADEAAALLDRAGDARFAAKARLLARFIAEQPPQQTLYEALLEGLGYRVNQAPFLRLAQQAPYAALAQAAGRVLEQQRPAAIAGWLLAASGLDGATNPTLPPGFGGPVARREWALFRVRPANHPARRIQGAGTLLARFLTGNHPPGLAGGLTQAAAAGRPAILTAALTVEAAAGESTAPIGAGRARDLAVNVALPFLHAMHGNPAASPPSESRQPQSPSPATRPSESPYLDLYRRFPSLPANEIIRQMGEQLLPAQWRKAITGARRQQGLLHLAACLRGANSGSPIV